jgi:hypothetical protein
MRNIGGYCSELGDIGEREIMTLNNISIVSDRERERLTGSTIPDI